ncbi:copper chaperone [Chthonomonas calidirosea]|uniref:Mercuric transport protein MerT n=1 Tax=Chthonomonas calidirosea (strain DSM 23976 / ICMP 18418 / T49) TaxID=1303518 RepID=S0EYN8_CHTCT|nr:mercuric transporter MerT family protein [Chthonomonas calidirosea]CCW35066.1 Copper chaperone [Chthonomonas calidirosea T49]CEK20918.1 copper chaperone [Chthonomonas calidirosea]
MKKMGFLVGAVLTALAASACCVLPALLGAIGAGTAAGFGAVLTPYRPYFIALTLLFLGTGFYFAYRSEPSEEGSCCATDSPTGRLRLSRKISRFILWGVTALVLATILYPWLSEEKLRRENQQAQIAFSQDTSRSAATTAVFTVKELDCAACALRIQQALTHLKGVYAVRTDLKTRRVTVLYNPKQVAPAALQAQLTRQGFTVYGLADSKAKGERCCP